MSLRVAMLGVEAARDYIVYRALSLEPHVPFEVRTCDIPHPLALGFTTSIGLPEGQLADYRLELADGRGIHVREYSGFFRIHLDRIHPTLARWWDHLKEDAPEIALLVALGIVVAIIIALVLFARAIGKSGSGSR